MTGFQSLAVLCGGLFVLLATSQASAADVPDSVKSHPGKTAFVEAKCNKCHPVVALGIERTKEPKEGKEPPPDMSNAGAEGHSVDLLIKYFKKEDKMGKKKKHKKKFKGSDEQAKQIAEFVALLKFPQPE